MKISHLPSLYSRCILSSILQLVPSCQTVTITVWVGFPLSIPTLRQSLFHCKPQALRSFWEAGTWLFPGSLSPEQENNRGKRGNTERGSWRAGTNKYACRHAHSHTRTWTHIHSHTYTILAMNILSSIDIHTSNKATADIVTVELGANDKSLQTNALVSCHSVVSQI